MCIIYTVSSRKAQLTDNQYKNVLSDLFECTLVE